MKAYSKERRREVLAACDAGGGTRAVATRFGVSESWVRRVKQERREQGKTAPKLTRDRIPKWAPLEPRIREVVAAEPDLTLRELKERLGTELSVQTLCRALQRLKLTLKKSPDRRRARATRRGEAARGTPRGAAVARPRPVFVDETWAKTNMTRPRGRAPRGQRLYARVPHGHWKTTTFLAGLHTTGPTAPLVVDGAINGRLFLGWVRQHLVPTLSKGDVVVMDNLSSHKVAGVVEAVEKVGASVLYLPPYSPDFNPIEQMFAKFKWLLKSAAVRTVDALWQLCGDALDQFTPTECRNYIRNCGYRYT